MTHVCSGCWDSKNKVIVLNTNTVYARGLTKTLDSCFSPEFSIKVALKGVEKNLKTRKRGGKSTGITVDNQVERWASSQNVPKPHPKFLKLKNELTSRGYTPLVSQLTLGCNALRLGTKIDLLCRNRTGGLVLFELKCGFEDYYDVQNQGFMLFPFQDLKQSFRNKHYIQLWISCWLFQHSSHKYSGEKLENAFILHIYSDDSNILKLDIDPIPPWIVSDTERLEACLMVLKRTRNETLKRRRQIIRNGARRSSYKRIKR
jgi:hypothetical protein